MKAIRHFIPWFLVAACLPVSAQRGLKEIPPPDPELEKASFKQGETLLTLTTSKVPFRTCSFISSIDEWLC